MRRSAGGRIRMQPVRLALDSFCTVVSLILFFSLLLGGDRKSRTARLFLSMPAVNVLALAADLARSYTDGTGLSLLNQLSSFLLYVLGYLLLMLYSRYLLEYLAAKTAVSPTAFQISALLCLCGMLLTLVSRFTGLFYTITPENHYLRGSAFWLAPVLAIVILLLDGFILLNCRRDTPGRNVAFFLSSEGFPLAALGIQCAVTELTVVYPAATLSLLVIFISVQLERGKRIKEQDKELAEKRIAVMLSQIQPHFLYNILGSIEWLCETDPRKAQEATDELARFLRGNMDSLKTTKLIPGSRELEHIRHYLTLEELRFGSKLKVEYHIETADFFLPALSLQPLVENAVRHGVTKREEGGSISVITRQTLHDYVITIADNGVGFDPEEKDNREHMGLENVRSRLAVQCGGSLSIQSQVGVGTTVTVRIPKAAGRKRRQDSDENSGG